MMKSLRMLLCVGFVLSAFGFAAQAQDEATNTVTILETNLPDGYVGAAVSTATYSFSDKVKMPIVNGYPNTSLDVKLYDANGNQMFVPTDEYYPLFGAYGDNRDLHRHKVSIRLWDDNGNNLPDGSYSLKFNLTFDSGATFTETISFTFGEGKPLVYTPSQGAEVYSIDKLIIDCEDNIYATGQTIMFYQGSSIKEYSLLGTNYTYNADTDTYEEAFEHTDVKKSRRVVVYLDQNYTEPGEYTFSIPEGFVTFANSLEGNERIDIKFTILASDKPQVVDYGVNLEEEQAPINDFCLTFSKELKSAEYGAYTETDENGMPIYTSINIELTDENGLTSNPLAEDASKIAYRVNSNVNFFNAAQAQIVTQTIDGKALPIGKYTLKIAAGAITAAAGATNDPIEFSFVIRDYKPITIFPTNGSSFYSLDEIAISCEDGIRHSGFPAELYKDGVLYNGIDNMKGWSYVFDPNNRTDSDFGSWVKFEVAEDGSTDYVVTTRVEVKLCNDGEAEPAEITEPGVYTIEFCEGFISYVSSKDVCPAFTYTFTIADNGGAGIEDVEVADNVPAVYYNLQGMKVDNQNLAPGVYIKAAAGKATKVVIK